MRNNVMALVSLLVLAAPAQAGVLLDADRAFAALAAKDGVPAAFQAVAHDDILRFDGNAQPVRGRAGLALAFKDFPKSAKLSWTPREEVLSAGADMGYTWGRWVLADTGPRGEKVCITGSYISIWRKVGSNWKLAADSGTPDTTPDRSACPAGYAPPGR
jgi:ketosteroid isomerase-like protein